MQANNQKHNINPMNDLIASLLWACFKSVSAYEIAPETPICIYDFAHSEVIVENSVNNVAISSCDYSDNHNKYSRSTKLHNSTTRKLVFLFERVKSHSWLVLLLIVIRFCYFNSELNGKSMEVQNE
jgi:hypothetical protein